MNRSRRPHSFSSTYSRSRSPQVGLIASHSAVCVLRFVLRIPELPRRDPESAIVQPRQCIMKKRPAFQERSKRTLRGGSVSQHLKNTAHVKHIDSQPMEGVSFRGGSQRFAKTQIFVNNALVCHFRDRLRTQKTKPARVPDHRR